VAGGTCLICAHPERAAIERALADEAALRWPARYFGTSPQALLRQSRRAYAGIRARAGFVEPCVPGAGLGKSGPTPADRRALRRLRWPAMVDQPGRRR